MGPTRTGYEDIAAAFAENGLGEPPVPGHLRRELARRRDWSWSTREISDGGLYDPDELLDEVTGPCGDYVAVGVTGHGANSYFLTCRAIVGPVALFVQHGWGGVYMDQARQAATLNDLMAQAGAVLSQAARRDTEGRRLVVLVSPEKGWDVCQWVEMDGRTARELSVAARIGPDSALAAAQVTLEGDREPYRARVDATVRFDWQERGPLVLTERGPWVDGLPAAPAIYRFRFVGRDGPWIYIGETMDVARRMAHYRTGDPKLATNKWVHDLMVEHLRTDQSVEMDVADRATITLDHVTSELDLKDKLHRVLAESTAIATVPGPDLLNKH